MPIYDYMCDTCGFIDEILQKPEERAVINCPECGVGQFEPQLSAPDQFRLMGDGFYEPYQESEVPDE